MILDVGDSVSDDIETGWGGMRDKGRAKSLFNIYGRHDSELISGWFIYLHSHQTIVGSFRACGTRGTGRLRGP